MKKFIATLAVSTILMASSAYADEECAVIIDGDCMTEVQLESELARVLQEYESRATRLERITNPQWRTSRDCVNFGTNYNTYITENIRGRYVNWPDAVDLDRCFGTDEE